jgi:hypothetical protein
MACTYDIGDLVRVSVTFTNMSEAVVDPTGITLKYKTPGGVITTLTYPTDAALVRDSTGVYHADIDATEAGTWEYRFQGTGAVKAAVEGLFNIRSTSF